MGAQEAVVGQVPVGLEVLESDLAIHCTLSRPNRPVQPIELCNLIDIVCCRLYASRVFVFPPFCGIVCGCVPCVGCV